MSTSNRRIVITGLGAATPLGTGVDVFWQNLLAGKSGVRRIQSFNPEGLDIQIAAEVHCDHDAARYVKRAQDAQAHVA